MPRLLPPRPSLTQLRKQAKELLALSTADDQPTQQLFAQYLGSKLLLSTPKRAVLAHALLIIAREYGFASWPKLKQHVEALHQAAQLSTGRLDSARLRQARKQARQQHIQLLAEHLLSAAQQQDLAALFRALVISARDGLAVRSYLVAQGQYGLIIDLLLTGVAHPSARIRFLTAQALDHFADQRCAEALQRLLHDPVPRVRWAAIHSLQCAACKLTPLATGDDIVTMLIDLARNDPSVKVRRVAAYELGQVCPDPRAIAALEQLQAETSDSTILRHTRQALGRHAQTRM